MTGFLGYLMGSRTDTLADVGGRLGHGAVADQQQFAVKAAY